MSWGAGTGAGASIRGALYGRVALTLYQCTVRATRVVKDITPEDGDHVVASSLAFVWCLF